MKFKKVNENFYNFELIEILKFNYDGKGSAIAKMDDHFEAICPEDLDLIMFGDPGTGSKWYELIN